MASINLIEAFQEFKDAENIDRPTMMKVVEDVFKTLLRKKFGADDNFDVIVNQIFFVKFPSAFAFVFPRRYIHVIFVVAECLLEAPSTTCLPRAHLGAQLPHLRRLAQHDDRMSVV